jgi:hypothetical protein
MERAVSRIDENADPFADDPVRPRVDAFGLTVHDVVANIGGWMCDKGRAGWDVAVDLVQPGDTTPLAIVGARVLGGDPREWPRRPIRGRGLRNVVAISAEALARDGDMRKDVQRILRRGWTDILLWGTPAVGFDHECEPECYVMSCAAAAFKRKALSVMTGRLEQVESIENFSHVVAPAAGRSTPSSTSAAAESSGLRNNRA